MNPLDLTAYAFTAALLTAVTYFTSWLILRALLFFFLRLHFISLFVRTAAQSQMLNGPSTITRCFIYGNAVFERWKRYQANGYSVEDIDWGPKDALDATVPVVPQSMPHSSPVWDPRNLRQAEKDEDLQR